MNISNAIPRWCNAYRLVLLVSAHDARLDAYISSRDLQQAQLQLDDCRNWAIPFNELNRVLDLVFKPLPWGDRGFLPSQLRQISETP